MQTRCTTPAQGVTIIKSQIYKLNFDFNSLQFHFQMSMFPCKPYKIGWTFWNVAWPHLRSRCQSHLDHPNRTINSRWKIHSKGTLVKKRKLKEFNSKMKFKIGFVQFHFQMDSTIRRGWPWDRRPSEIHTPLHRQSWMWRISWNPVTPSGQWRIKFSSQKCGWNKGIKSHCQDLKTKAILINLKTSFFLHFYLRKRIEFLWVCFSSWLSHALKNFRHFCKNHFVEILLRIK